MTFTNSQVILLHFKFVLPIQEKVKWRDLNFHAGLPAADAPKKISGVHKRCWRYIPNSNKLPVSEPSVSIPTENAPTAEVQTTWGNSMNYKY